LDASWKKEPSILFRVAGGPVLPDGGAVHWLHARPGHRLRVAVFAPSGAAHGSVVLSPGRTEPIEKYGEVVSELLARGLVVLVHDWAGQGLSGRFLPDPLCGDIAGGWQVLLADYFDILDAYGEELPRPWIAMGHSMGGALTALALSEGEARFAGAVLCAPMIEFSAGKVPIWAVRTAVHAAFTLKRETHLARKQSDPSQLRFKDNDYTHDPARFERTIALLRAHPELRVGEPTWRWLSFALALHDRLLLPGAAERITCPLAAVAAGRDRLVSTRAIRHFVRRVPRGIYTELPKAYHEILVETDEHRAAFWSVFDRVAAQVFAENT
jgi:lysophospholipase